MVHCPAAASRTKLEARGGGEGVEDLLGAVVDHGPGVEVVVGQGDVGDLDVVAGVDVDAVGVVARNGAPRRGQEDDQVAHAHRIGWVEAAQDVPGVGRHEAREHAPGRLRRAVGVDHALVLQAGQGAFRVGGALGGGPGEHALQDVPLGGLQDDDATIGVEGTHAVTSRVSLMARKCSETAPNSRVAHVKVTVHRWVPSALRSSQATWNRVRASSSRM